MASNAKLKVLTLNCWGLKYVAKNRVDRIQAIAAVLSQSDYDIVALQELWVSADYELIKTSIAKQLPYAKFFYSGALGSGLAIYSRFRIINATIHPYSLSGEPLNVLGGDWFVGKAAASIVIQHPVLHEVEIFNTHLCTKGEDGPEYTRPYRLINAWEFSKLVQTSASLGRYVIAAGDFNCIPTALPMQIIVGYTGLSDAWAVSRESSTQSRTNLSVTTADDAIMQFGVTADSPLNSYSAGKPLDSSARKHFGKRLDYILYKNPDVKRRSGNTALLHCNQCRVMLTEKLPGTVISYSDHFGLEAAIDIVPSVVNMQDADGPLPLSSFRLSLPDELLATMLTALTLFYRKSSQRSCNELLIFAISVVMLIALCIGSSWLHHSWSRLIVSLAIFFVSWLGTTMLYSGFLFGHWEKRALISTIEELECIRQARTQEAI